MKKALKYTFALMLCVGLIFFSTTESFCFTSRQLRAFEAKWGEGWSDLYRSGSQEFRNYEDWNRGYWDNPTDPPANFNWVESSVDVVPRDDPRWAGSNGSTVAAAPAKPKCDHTYDMIITKSPTCMEAGIAEYTCSKCSDKYTMDLEATGIHDYVSEITKEASCTEDGEDTYTCLMCGDSYTEAIPKTEHKYTDKVTKVNNCTEDGENTFTCEMCGDSYADVIPARGHSNSSFETTVPNGLFTEGEEVKTCPACGEIMETRTIPSEYPIEMLYIGIGVSVVILIIVISTIIGIKKNKK